MVIIIMLMIVETNRKLSLEALQAHIDLFEPLGETLGLQRPLTPAVAHQDMDNASKSSHATSTLGLGISVAANEDMNSVLTALLDKDLEDSTTQEGDVSGSTTTVMSSEEYQRKLEEIKKHNESKTLKNVVDEMEKEVDKINLHHEQLEEHLVNMSSDSPRGLTDEEKDEMRRVSLEEKTSASYMIPLEQIDDVPDEGDLGVMVRGRQLDVSGK